MNRREFFKAAGIGALVYAFSQKYVFGRDIKQLEEKVVGYVLKTKESLNGVLDYQHLEPFNQSEYKLIYVCLDFDSKRTAQIYFKMYGPDDNRNVLKISITPKNYHLLPKHDDRHRGEEGTGVITDEGIDGKFESGDGLHRIGERGSFIINKGKVIDYLEGNPLFLKLYKDIVLVPILKLYERM